MKKCAVIVSKWDVNKTGVQYFPVGTIVHELRAGNFGYNMWESLNTRIKMTDGSVNRTQTLNDGHYTELPEDYTQDDIDAAIVAILLKQ